MTPDRPPPEPIAGQNAAGAALRHYGAALHRYLRPRLNNPDDVQDLAQEVFMRFLQISQQETIRNPQAFLYRLAANFVHEFRMREKRDLVSCDSELADLMDEVAADVWTNRLEERLSAAQAVARRLKALPPLWQAILLMAKRDGLSADEIARKVNLSKKTVYIYLGYAIAQFKQGQQDL